MCCPSANSARRPVSLGRLVRHSARRRTRCKSRRSVRAFAQPRIAQACSVTLIFLMALECRVANLPKVCRAGTEGVFVGLQPNLHTGGEIRI